MARSSHCSIRWPSARIPADVLTRRAASCAGTGGLPARWNWPRSTRQVLPDQAHQRPRSQLCIDYYPPLACRPRSTALGKQDVHHVRPVHPDGRQCSATISWRLRAWPSGDRRRSLRHRGRRRRHRRELAKTLPNLHRRRHLPRRRRVLRTGSGWSSDAVAARAVPPRNCANTPRPSCWPAMSTCG